VILSKLRHHKRRECPTEYIKKTIDLFKSNNGKIIVEIGTMRALLTHPIDSGHCKGCMDGHSTMWWATTGAEVYSVDISKESIDLTSKTCENFKNVHAIVRDGLEFLKSFEQPIDLLFLDAWDVVDGTPYAEKHLEAYFVAKPHLHENSLILIDDTDIKDCGKGRLVIPQAIKDGYTVVFSGRQTLLAKKTLN
jgi:hypothetical protein